MCCELFPRLRERLPQAGGSMSGGEQQMLAIGRALMAQPRLLLLDEPSMGLAPMLIRQIFGIITRDQRRGARPCCWSSRTRRRRCGGPTGPTCWRSGRIVREGAGRALLDDAAVRAAYLGGSVE